MDDQTDDAVDDLISQLQGNVQVARDIETKEEFKLNKDELEDFLLQHSGKLIKGSVDFVDDVKQFITSAPDAKDLEAFSKLVGASAAAIESLNKILMSNKKIEATEKLKIMDIESKKQLQDSDNEAKLFLNREELMKQLLDNAQIIDADVTDK
tara:strand:+ start:113 stop:571 length:459 start_codon:yes stop_codon:yes gene_type:complete